ncbi:hypothetical protein A9K65_032950 (plasmid) [Mesorhizobium sp. WSM1497]|nr:hypothetical protein A9K65_032950 [Mesorhizobium sp. WSM1497]
MLATSEEPKPVAVKDALAMDRNSIRTFDQDGHLRVEMTPISKANVCPYYGREIPDFEALGLDPKRVYRLYRDADELAKAAPTFVGKPLLLKHIPVSARDHPREAVVGALGDALEFHAPYLMAPLSIWDGAAIALIESDRQKELSSSYRYRADMTPGTLAGESYDGVMRDISANHVALVEEGRAGPDVVVGDSKMEIITMKKTALLSRMASVAQGAILAHIMPKLASDQKIDVSGALAGVTAENFKAKRPAIIEAVGKAATFGVLTAGGTIAGVFGVGDLCRGAPLVAFARPQFKQTKLQARLIRACMLRLCGSGSREPAITCKPETRGGEDRDDRGCEAVVWRCALGVGCLGERPR